MPGSTFKWDFCAFLLFFPTLFQETMETLHVMGCGFNSSFRDHLQKIRLFPYLLLEDCSLEEGKQEIGESTLFGNNCKGPLCDPYQKIPDLIFLLGHKLRWAKQQLEKDTIVAPLGIPVSTMLIFLVDILTKYHIWKYYFIILCMVLLGQWPHNLHSARKFTTLIAHRMDCSATEAECFLASHLLQYIWPCGASSLCTLRSIPLGTTTLCTSPCGRGQSSFRYPSPTRICHYLGMA